MPKIRPIPDGFRSVTPSLIVPNATKALEFYAKAFGAETLMRMPGPDGETTMHAEMRIGDSIVMLCDENPDWGCKAPGSLGGSAGSLHLYVDDADALFARALEAGCETTMPLMNAFWGDRYGKVKDPFGHEWGIATHVEDVRPEDMPRRMQEWFASMGSDC